MYVQLASQVHECHVYTCTLTIFTNDHYLLHVGVGKGRQAMYYITAFIHDCCIKM